MPKRTRAAIPKVDSLNALPTLNRAQRRALIRAIASQRPRSTWKGATR